MLRDGRMGRGLRPSRRALADVVHARMARVGAGAVVPRRANGEAAGDESGASVALSADGGRLAVGAPFNDGTGADSGHARVYDVC